MENLYVNQRSSSDSIAGFLLLESLHSQQKEILCPYSEQLQQATEMLYLSDKRIMMCLVPSTRWSNGA